ncbi:MAG: hypothetical protein ACFHWX_07440 [Bacteroidota bacterium]
MRRIVYFLPFFICNLLFAQQGSVGIGTQTPNEKAVLQLVAPNNNQGLLIPTLTTTQRNAFAAQLTSSDNGMMVYDSEANQFYFWLVDHWEAVGAALQAGVGVEIVNGVINNTGDTDPSDDFSGDWADLANIPAEFADGTDEVNDGDADPTNELQDLNLTGNVLTVTGLSTPTQIDLATYLGANTDEQNLQFATGQITLSGDPDNTIIDLSNYDTDVTDDFTGDWSDLANVPIGFSDGVDEVDDADNDPTNEIELPSTAGLNEVLVFDGSSWVAGTDQVDDADNDPTNEIELPSTAGTNEVLLFDGSNWIAGTDQVNDADNDPANEIELPETSDADGNMYREYQDGNYLKALNFMTDQVLADASSVTANVLDIAPFKFIRTVLFTPDPSVGTLINFIQVNNSVSGQELILINVGATTLTLENYDPTGNLYLPMDLGIIDLGPGGSIHMMYVDDGNGFKGWVTISMANNYAPGTSG